MPSGTAGWFDGRRSWSQGQILAAVGNSERLDCPESANRLGLEMLTCLHSLKYGVNIIAYTTHYLLFYNYQYYLFSK